MPNKWNWDSAKTARGAGIIVVRKFNESWKVLGLWARGGYDIPKGHIDAKDPDHFSTAQRECFEETQILVAVSDLLTKSVYQDKKLTIFCAETLQDPVLIKNPESENLNMLDFIGCIRM